MQEFERMPFIWCDYNIYIYIYGIVKKCGMVEQKKKKKKEKEGKCDCGKKKNRARWKRQEFAFGM